MWVPSSSEILNYTIDAMLLLLTNCLRKSSPPRCGAFSLYIFHVTNLSLHGIYGAHVFFLARSESSWVSIFLFCFWSSAQRRDAPEPEGWEQILYVPCPSHKSCDWGSPLATQRNDDFTAHSSELLSNYNDLQMGLHVQVEEGIWMKMEPSPFLFLCRVAFANVKPCC